MMFYRTGRGRRAQRRVIKWYRYRNRYDKLTAHQDLTHKIQHPIRCTPGFFRAEDPRIARDPELRHGC